LALDGLADLPDAVGEEDPPLALHFADDGTSSAVNHRQAFRKAAAAGDFLSRRTASSHQQRLAATLRYVNSLLVGSAGWPSRVTTSLLIGQE
jgi:hypothetical protein